MDVCARVGDTHILRGQIQLQITKLCVTTMEYVTQKKDIFKLQYKSLGQ